MKEHSTCQLVLAKKVEEKHEMHMNWNMVFGVVVVIALGVIIGLLWKKHR